MKNYVKPTVLANEELAEGVYAASGTGRLTINIESGNAYDPWHDYQIYVKNDTSETVTGWSVTLTFNDIVSRVNGDNVQGSTINGYNVTLTFAPDDTNWLASIKPGHDRNFHFQVEGQNTKQYIQLVSWS